MAAILILGTGCARYEFDLVEPAALSRHIGSKSDSVIRMDPLEYRFRAYEGRLVVRVFNPTDDPIRLLGDQSTVVDPRGQSHPLRSATIEPESFVQLVLPPEPIVAPAGPSFGIGIGFSQGKQSHHPRVVPAMHRPYRSRFYGRYYHGWPYRYDPWYWDYYAPRYYVLYADTDYWQWNGETEVRLALAFERNSKLFRDAFTFRRVKMKS